MKFLLKFGIIVIVIVMGFSALKGRIATNTKYGSSSSAETTTAYAYGTKNETTKASLEFNLVAGELGIYGKYRTLNEGTDMPHKRIEHHVPKGMYKVTNVGKYMTQEIGRAHV